MSQYSPEALQAELDRINQRKAALARGQQNSPVQTRNARDLGNVNYQDFAPQVMDTALAKNEFANSIYDQIGNVSTQATARSGVEAQNRFNFEQLQKEQARLEEARKNRVKQTQAQIKPPKPLTTPTINPNLNQGTGTHATQQNINQTNSITGGTPATGGSSYYTQTPSWLNINAGLTTFQAGGHTWTTNASVAGRFQGFINALTATGYKIKTAGSYADRNQANGSGNRSLHSYGLAIDINAFAAGNSYNPGGAGKHYTDMPKGISALAAKYGLVWGGDWKNSKDYMHFSIPYNGLLRNQQSGSPAPGKWNRKLQGMTANG